MQRLVLIDGHAILHRAFHAYPPLTTSKGELVGAVYGFTNILLTVLRELGPKYVAVAFDLPKPTFRHKKFKGYKAKRPEMAEELSDQIGRVKQVVETLKIPIFAVEGYEADDIIGTLSLQAKVPKIKNTYKKSKRFKDLEVVIVTGDQDALQLVSDNVKVYMPARGKKPAEIIDRKKFIKRYQFEPRYLVDLKALSGDPSDQIPGVSGIGPKTATDLILHFGDLKSIYENLDKTKDQIRDKLIRDKDQAFMSYGLAKIATKVSIDLDLKECQLSDYDKKEVLDLFEELEFKSLIKKLPDDSWEAMVRETMDRKKAKRETKEEAGKQMGLF